MDRLFTSEKRSVWKGVELELGQCVIRDSEGKVIFERDSVEVPKSWSQLAIDILVSKYFKSVTGPKKREESSIKQVIQRIVRTLAREGVARKYFSPTTAEVFQDELTYLLIHQYGAFNSPVWFNLGLWHEYGIEGSGGNYYFDPKSGDVRPTKNAFQYPQCSACFIQSIEDDLGSIFDLLKSEARLFKYGSGTGTNFSKLRGKQERLSGGGNSSGLISFLEIFDKAAAATKSGGTTRRAAKMVCLNVDHPEIIDFIEWKNREEKKARALIAAGYSPDFEGDAYKTVSGQNSNNSVRVTDRFMAAVEKGETWDIKSRTTGKVLQKIPAKELWQKIAKAAWNCADPGVQFDSTINEWHTCSESGRIEASNPCSEFMFLDDTACNLASLNLLKFLNNNGEFEIEKYLRAIRIFVLAQEILVGMSSYPTRAIAEKSNAFRPLGLGYANLGALLMVLGLPYDSNGARQWAAVLTSILTAHAYRVSAEIAKVKGAFQEFRHNRSSMLKVIKKHRRAAEKIGSSENLLPPPLLETSQLEWKATLELGEKFGFRNAQVTVLAPTGTIGLLMDCDTTGVEPDYALVKYKKLSGGGNLRIVNQSFVRALERLNYSSDEIEKIRQQLLNENVSKLPVREEHRRIFDCAGDISPDGHLHMMAAVQPLLSGAISKTVNLPHSSSSEEIGKIYYSAWKLGLKAIAIYRDGSKLSQPLRTSVVEDVEICDQCGHKTHKSAGCSRCLNCGNSLGCS